MNYWDEYVIIPIKECFEGYREIRGGDSINIERSVNACTEDNDQIHLLDSLKDIYRDYCLGKWRNVWLQGVMNRMVAFDGIHGKVIPSFDVVDLAFSWAKNNESVRLDEFIDILTTYDLLSADEDWEQLENRVNDELRKLKVYGDQTKSGYLALLHAFIRIRRDFGDSNLDKQNELLKLLERHWDFLKLVYSVMIRRIVDNGNRDFAAIANNMRVQKSNHKYVYIFYAALKERIDDLSDTEDGKSKINRHLKELLKIQKDTPQDNETLDELCTTLFPEELRQFLDKNNIKSYDEVMSELQEMKAKVDSLNSQVAQMAQRMADAIKASIPVENIEVELLRLQPGTSYDVFTQVNSLLTGTKAWMERANEIKQKILDKRDNPTIVKGNYYASGSHHDDKSRHIEIDKNDDLPKLPEK